MTELNLLSMYCNLVDGEEITSFTILINIQLFVDVVSKWNSWGAKGKYSSGLCLASSQRTLTVAATTPFHDVMK